MNSSLKNLNNFFKGYGKSWFPGWSRIPHTFWHDNWNLIWKLIWSPLWETATLKFDLLKICVQIVNSGWHNQKKLNVKELHKWGGDFELLMWLVYNSIAVPYQDGCTCIITIIFFNICQCAICCFSYLVNNLILDRLKSNQA